MFPRGDPGIAGASGRGTRHGHPVHFLFVVHDASLATGTPNGTPVYLFLFRYDRPELRLRGRVSCPRDRLAGILYPGGTNRCVVGILPRGGYPPAAHPHHDRTGVRGVSVSRLIPAMAVKLAS